MGSVITRGDFAKYLWPTVRKTFGMSYAQHELEYIHIFETAPSRKAFEEDMTYSGFGLAAVKPEGSAITYDNAKQGFLTRYENITYALGFMVSREAFEDDHGDVIGNKKAKDLSMSMIQTKETNGANVLNNAFDSNYTGGDGLELCSTAHLNKAGGTWSNELTTAADLSEASLEQAGIDIMDFKNDRGLQIKVRPKSLIIPPELCFEAERLLKSVQRVGTAENDISAIVSKNLIPMGAYVNHFLTDADAWFMKTDVEGLMHFERRKLEFGADGEFDTENAKFKATERYSFGWSDPRAIFGSPGA